MKTISNNLSESEILKTILSEIQQINEKISKLNPESILILEWIPRSEVMKYLDYGDTQIREFEISHKLITTKIGSRKFFKRESLIEVLEKNISKSHD